MKTATAVLAALLLSSAAEAQLAPGAPGERATWTGANKQGVGSAAQLDSRVWFSLGAGALQEVYYPALDQANTRLTELVFSGGGQVEREGADADTRAELADPEALLYRQVNTARSGRWRVTKTTLADPARPVVLQRVRIERLQPGPLRAFVFFDPAVANSGLHDSGYLSGGALVAEDGGVAVALAASTGFAAANAGYLGTSDGLAELRAGRPLPGWRRAADGNVAFLAELRLPAGAAASELTLALGFGPEGPRAVEQARASLARPWAQLERDYARGWHEWLATLRRVSGPAAAQFDACAMLLKAHEDKTARGAMVASLTKPWGDESDAGEPTVGGYHLVWSRDLYHVATAFLALGDKGAADRALRFLFEVQQKPDGSFPQNSWLDGRPYWTSLQLDEAAYPLILAHELGRVDSRSWEKHVKPAADFIVAHGPATPQERWEEEPGYSPSTIAAEIAGLVAAAAIAERNGDAASAGRYREVARDWSARLEGWTVASAGPHSAEPYFLRLSQEGRPDSGQPLEINNGGGAFDEREIVDAGFLELVRLGLRRPDDPLVARSVAVVDRVLRRETPHGPGFYRYNRDGYGEKPDGRGYDGTGVGRLWPLLTGERGEYELANGRDARPWLQAMAGFANASRMLPEQVWDRAESPRPHLSFGAGTGSATPLAWSCAGFIRLAVGIEDGRPAGQPAVVRDFFAR